MKYVIQMFAACAILFSSLHAQELPKAPKQYLKQSQRFISLYGISLGHSGRITDPSTGAILVAGKLRTKLSLGYGQMITDKVMLGARIGYNGLYSLQKSPARVGAYHAINAELFGRYYFTQGRWNPFVEVGIGAETLQTGPKPNLQVSSFYQEARLGIMYHLNENVSFEFSNGVRFTQYTQNRPWMTSTSQKSEIGFLNPKLGINFRF